MNRTLSLAVYGSIMADVGALYAVVDREISRGGALRRPAPQQRRPPADLQRRGVACPRTPRPGTTRPKLPSLQCTERAPVSVHLFCSLTSDFLLFTFRRFVL